MPITRQEVEHVALLSRLELTEQEKARFAEQLDAILAYMGKLNELDTEGIEPMVHGIEGTEPVRLDELGQSLPRQEALQNAPESRDGYFKVPRIIE